MLLYKVFCLLVPVAVAADMPAGLGTLDRSVVKLRDARLYRDGDRKSLTLTFNQGRWIRGVSIAALGLPSD
jgi:hypothetical protein